MRSVPIPTPYFEIDETYEGDWVRLQLTGELDLGSAPVLRDRLMELRLERRLVRLDLSVLEFMDSSGVHVLVDAFNHARVDGWELAIDPGLSPQVHSVFKLAGLDRMISTRSMNGG